MRSCRYSQSTVGRILYIRTTFNIPSIFDVGIIIVVVDIITAFGHPLVYWRRVGRRGWSSIMHTDADAAAIITYSTSG